MKNNFLVLIILSLFAFVGCNNQSSPEYKFIGKFNYQITNDSLFSNTYLSPESLGYVIGDLNVQGLKINGIENLKKENVLTMAIEQVESAIFLQDFKVQKDQKYALVFGNEVFGVEEDVLKNCDTVLEIPQLGTKHSLNISVSLGITVWDLMVKLRGFD